MVKNHSRKIKKKGGDKNHLGGDVSVIPNNIVVDRQSTYEKDNNPNVTVEPNSGKKEEPVDDIPPSTDGVESSKLQFQFTRHVMSCNNLDEGKWYSVGKDFEPGATAYGIEKTIGYARSEQKDYFNFNHVYVSNLYRTWITAVLLYGTNLTQDDTLNLYISPHLKEYHKIILGKPLERGNFPKEINHMAKKFLKFLETLKTLDDNAKSIGGNSLVGRPNYVVELPGSYSKGYSNIKDDNWTKAIARNNEINAEFYRNLPNNIILHLPPKKNSKETQKITYTKKDGDKYKVESFCKIQDTAGPNSGPEFIETGNLQQFMEWYNGNSEITNYYKKHQQENKVHIVTHSHIMREYLARFQIDANESIRTELNRAMLNAKTEFKAKLRYIINQFPTNLKFDLDLLQYYDYKGDKEPGPIYPIRNSNCWHFITTTENKDLIDKSVDGAIKEFDLHAGVPIIKKMAKDMEGKTPNSLCGKKGSVKPMSSEICPKTGGRKTRKRHIRRTKKRSKRKNNKSRKHHK